METWPPLRYARLDPFKCRGPAVVTRTEGTALDTLSRLVLAQRRLSRAGRADQASLLAELRPYLPFDSAWWGLHSGLVLHGTHGESLAPTFGSEWETVKEQDVIARALVARPGAAFVFGPDAFEEVPAFGAFLASHGVRHVLGVSAVQSGIGLSAFLSLYRREAPFERIEAQLFQAAFPHMMESLRHGWQLLRDSEVPTSAAAGCRALVDGTGLILSADDSFGKAIARRWPDWCGPRLPEALIAMLGRAGRLALGEVWATLVSDRRSRRRAFGVGAVR